MNKPTIATWRFKYSCRLCKAFYGTDYAGDDRFCPACSPRVGKRVKRMINRIKREGLNE